jgi:ubiquinone/menaquinone biosynthesis C-methylase UbiE
MENILMASIGEDITKKLIENVEISQNMKILDLGCGNGDVSFLISKYIGNNGIVVGIDSNKNVISNAINKSKEFGLSNTNFILGDLTEDFQIEYSDFDVVIVRRVLMYLSNPIKTITNAIRYLKPNGIFLVQENDVSLTPINLEFMPEHKKIIEYIRKTLEKENVNFKIGFDLN